MRKIVCLIVILISIVACSQAPVSKEEPSLRRVFQAFINLAELKKYDDAKLMLVDENAKELTIDITQEQIAGYFSMVSSLKNVFSDKDQVFEAVSKSKGCLTANGYIESEPKTLKVAFVEEKGIWKIAMMHVAYLKSPEEFASKAVCPEADR